MGWLENFFKRNKILLLYEGENNYEKYNISKLNIDKMDFDKSKVDKIKEEAMKVKVFSSRKGSSLVYSIEIFDRDQSVQIAKIVTEEQNKKDVNLKQIVKEMENAIQPLSEVTNPYTLEKIKKVVMEKLEAIVKVNSNLSLNEYGKKYINEYQPQSFFDYGELDKLPRKIDTSRMSPEDLYRYGMQLEKRLNMLDNIKTSEDAYKDKENLVYYMRQQENVPINPIIDVNLEYAKEGKQLDEELVIKIAKKMEKFKNEDGSLYSVYLKIEEKRIWKQIEKQLIEYVGNLKYAEEISDIGKISYLMEELNKYELQDVSGGFTHDILTYMIDEIGDRDVEDYTRNIKPKDFKLATFINSKPDIPKRADMIKFLYARMGSIGQLSCKTFSNDKNDKQTLREFIINTDFKHEDATESKQFLLLVAQIEKDYIQREYGKIIDFFKEKEEKEGNKSFKERMEIGYTPTANLEKQSQTSVKEKERIE